jgi:hypothetical protein
MKCFLERLVTALTRVWARPDTTGRDLATTHTSGYIVFR